jgi:hypothetical protein
MPVRGIVFGTPRVLRRQRVRRNRVAVGLVGAVLAWTGWHAATAPHVGAEAATRGGSVEEVAGPAEDHAPTGTDSLDGLTSRMRGSVQAAIDGAAAQGVSIEIVSAHRSAADQQVLFEQAVARYGTPAAARRWVLPPSDSEHVSGGAVDVGPRAAAAWLEENGVRYGLCRRYVNEWWHFERLAGPKGAKCPSMEADAAG